MYIHYTFDKHFLMVQVEENICIDFMIIKMVSLLPINKIQVIVLAIRLYYLETTTTHL